MHMCIVSAVGQGEARCQLKEETRQEHPCSSPRQLCIGRAGRRSEEAGVHPLVLRLEEMEGLSLEGGQRQARRDLGQ